MWYVGFLVMGVLVGGLGDKWNLGFLVEIECQVEVYFDSYLFDFLREDVCLWVIVEQMCFDEIRYVEMVIYFGVIELLVFVKIIMKMVVKVMIMVVYCLQF